MNDRPRLKTLLGNYPNTLALRSGALKPASFDFDFLDIAVPNRAFRSVVREHAFDVAELALATYFQAIAYGKPFALLPAVVGAGRFQHHCLVYNAERGRVTIAQLEGKRVGIRAYAQTTVAWVRGVIAEDYGVHLPAVRWVTFEDGHLAEYPDPPGVQRAPAGASQLDMLLAGELDAVILGSDLPDDPRLQPVLPDPHAAAIAWSERLQMLPINHMVAVDLSLCRERPETVRDVYAALSQSKALARAAEPDGRDMTPFGIEPNRRTLDVLLGYSYRQGLIPRQFSVDELFAETIHLLEPR